MTEYCHHYTAASLEEYLEIISLVNDTLVESDPYQRYSPIWYRGHERQDYLLMPTLLRGSSGMGASYGRDHLREDLRYQHFRSKCNQLVDTAPTSKIEWQEILQHHLGSTRLMDWSESAISALMFALEAFIDPLDNKELEYRRLTVTPTVWVLAPARLNGYVYKVLSQSRDLIQAAVQDLIAKGFGKKCLTDTICTLLHDGQEFYFENNDKMSMNGIFCLAAIESERRACGERMKYLLRNAEFNPFFYLLLRYYNDGLPLSMETLPPLAIVHPYHSRRIQSQHGVFTVMPHYQIKEEEIGGIRDKRPMERQSLIQDCLCRIKIARPAKVAKELLAIGERRVNLYPELDNYVRDMESKKWHV